MEAKRARRNKILIAWGTFFSSFGFFFLAGKLEQPWFVFVGCLTILASLIMGATWCRLLVPTKIDENFVYLRFKNQELLKKIFFTCNATRISVAQPPAIP
jgi:hypothetical protein